ncbi:hypothetical protein BDV30DRAFT_206103 [Aspergillus minisclerotigenes]|uniref:Uncharacterized protein n=1 Tax=Aspergillus minisclerotigenes TaxID=656917 RepID=A0A5N6JD84_9EURO|nr:hypothetical protein BDV30DRAFT_206103 [Aspergillus minisclerotigenes]
MVQRTYTILILTLIVWVVCVNSRPARGQNDPKESDDSNTRNGIALSSSIISDLKWVGGGGWDFSMLIESDALETWGCQLH